MVQRQPLLNKFNLIYRKTSDKCTVLSNPAYIQHCIAGLY